MAFCANAGKPDEGVRRGPGGPPHNLPYLSKVHSLVQKHELRARTALFAITITGETSQWIRRDAAFSQLAPRPPRSPQPRVYSLRRHQPCPFTKKAPFASTIRRPV